jgi:hypothetical protein
MSTAAPSSSLRDARRRAYARLVSGHAALAPTAPAEVRWTWLMAAHVVGQPVFRLHLDSHWRMLRQAWAQADAREAAGQLLRLALVPLGHTLRRLPAGNVGRSTVSAFRPMRPPQHVRRLVAWSLRPTTADGEQAGPWPAQGADEPL